MTAASTPEAVKQIHYLAAALKAPRITEAAARLAEQARDAGWSFEDYLAAVLEREVSARNASGAQLRIRAAGFLARKTLEDFEWDVQPAIRQQVASLASGAFLTEARNIVLLGPPGTGKTHLATGLGTVAAQHGHRVLFATAVCDRLFVGRFSSKFLPSWWQVSCQKSDKNPATPCHPKSREAWRNMFTLVAPVPMSGVLKDMGPPPPDRFLLAPPFH